MKGRRTREPRANEIQGTARDFAKFIATSLMTRSEFSFPKGSRVILSTDPAHLYALPSEGTVSASSRRQFTSRP